MFLRWAVVPVMEREVHHRDPLLHIVEVKQLCRLSALV
jgi:hypothetical protein